MRNTFASIMSALMLVLCVPASGQLPAPNESGVSTGHIHIVVPNPAKYVEIFRLLGGEVMDLGGRSTVRFPGMFILIREGEPAVTSIQTSANHVGFSVNDYALYKARLEAVGAGFFYDDPDGGQILADMPDGLRLEILTDTDQSQAIVFHHMHLVAADLEGLQSWYLEVFGAEASERRGLPSAVVPGGRVDIMGATGDLPVGSQGGVIDHIGFEVADMDAFAAHLQGLGIEFDQPPRMVENLNTRIAFLTDPAGTYIEVTEGLDRY